MPVRSRAERRIFWHNRNLFPIIENIWWDSDGERPFWLGRGAETLWTKGAGSQVDAYLLSGNLRGRMQKFMSSSVRNGTTTYMVAEGADLMTTGRTHRARSTGLGSSTL